MHGNIGNLRPYNDSFFIAQIIKILIVLIMCTADGIGSHGQDQLHIPLVHLLRQRIANSCAVLVSGHSV